MGVDRPDSCFITGASGFFGRRVVAALSTAHPAARLRVLVHRRPVALDAPNIETHAGSLDDLAGLLRGLRGVDVVVHLAAATHASRPETYFRVNAAGTEHLVEAARKAGVKRFIFISSRAIQPACGDYARSKWVAEQAVRSSGIPHVILRFSEIYGEGSSEGINALIALVRKVPIVPYPSGPVSLAPLFLDDAVTAVLRVIERPQIRNRTYTLAGPRVHDVREIVRIVSDAFALRRVRVPIPLGLLSLAARVSGMAGLPLIRPDQFSRLRCEKEHDIEAAKLDLGFSPIPFDEGIRRMRAASGKRAASPAAV